MSQQLYFSMLRTASPYPMSRIEVKDGMIEVIYEKGSKGFKKSMKLDKDPAKNMELLLEFAKTL